MAPSFSRNGNPVGILDEFTEVTKLPSGKYAMEAYTRTAGARGPFRQIEGSWGALKDHFAMNLSNNLDVVFRRGSRGVLIRPFIRFNGQDRLLVTVAHQFPGMAGLVDYERHGLKYALGFNDPTGRIDGLGFEFAVFGDGMSLDSTTEKTYVGQDVNGDPEFWDVPVAVVKWQDNELFLISTSPLLKIEDPEWRPYRDVNKVRVDFTPGRGKRIELDPSISLPDTATVNGFIIWSTGPGMAIAAVTSGGTKSIGDNGSGFLYRMYDRFDLASLPTDATVTLASYRVKTSTVGEIGGPDNAVWRCHQGWNILTDPLATGDWGAVAGQSGSKTSDFDDNSIQTNQSNVNVWIPVQTSWIRGGSSDLHDIETRDISTYTASNWRTWNVYRTPADPYLYLEYTVPATTPLLYTPHAGI
ncbi:MAG: hypothetical protein ACE5FA_00345 [Dehalococcoidia bacterium]